MKFAIIVLAVFLAWEVSSATISNELEEEQMLEQMSNDKHEHSRLKRACRCNQFGCVCSNKAVECHKVNDLIVLLDGSASVSTANYETAKSFVDKLAAAYVVQSGSRFGFTTFGTDVRKVVPLTNTLSAADISTTILGASQSNSFTYTNLGIESALAEFTSASRSVPRNLVIITDGESSSKSLTLAEINKAINMGIRTFSVGIGSYVDQQELLDIAGGNNNRIFTATTFDKLPELLKAISIAAC